jgi:hypothetical protein
MFRNSTSRRLSLVNRPVTVLVGDERIPMTVRRQPGRRNVERAAIRASLLGIDR